MRELSLLDRLAATFVGTIGYMFLTLVGRTLRVESIGVPNAGRCQEGTGRRAFAFWHGQLLPLAYTHRNRGICVLVSRHRDGEAIAVALRRLGFDVVRGSSTQGGLDGLFGMCIRAKEGLDLAVTPDGPKGPRHRAQSGIFYMAQRTGVAIVPTACFAASRILLNTWDRFQVPLPFSRVVIAYGAPLEVPRELGVPAGGEYARLLEQALARVEEQAVEYVGVTPKRRP